MTTFQRIEAVLKLKDVIAEQAKENQKASGGAVRLKLDKPVHTYKMLGERAGVSHGTVRKAEAILKKDAEGTVSEEDMTALRQGKKNVSRIHNKYCVDKTVPQKPTQDLSGCIKTTFSTLEKQFAHVDRIDFYERIIEWANTQKADLEETSG
jgi:hypothetical protein